jgi:hypothetical protein
VSFAFIDASVVCGERVGLSDPDQQLDECEDELAVFVGWNHCRRHVQQREM